MRLLPASHELQCVNVTDEAFDVDQLLEKVKQEQAVLLTGKGDSPDCVMVDFDAYQELLCRIAKKEASIQASQQQQTERSGVMQKALAEWDKEGK